MSIPLRSTALLACAAFLTARPALAEVREVELQSREDVLAGRSFGEAGAYERLTGRIVFGIDRDSAFNQRIVDLDHSEYIQALPDGTKYVRATADFMVLQPKDRTRGAGTALLEVSNRGGKASLAYFNAARSSYDPTDETHFGDGFLMRRGLTLIWVGWQFDVPDEPGRLRLDVPRLRSFRRDTYEGLVRSDWTVDRPTSTLALAHRNHLAYPVSEPEDPRVVLTVRDGRLAERRIVPRASYRFAVEDEAGEVVPDGTHIWSESGFEAGKIYELVYPATSPAIVGLGLAAIRDTISYAKYAEDCPFPVERGIGVGISQTGRFLRHFLYQGFNTDEQGRLAFDGMLIHTAGAGRGSFNHRFAQPSRDGHRYSAFFYPTDLFPFSGRTQRDPVSGERNGLGRVLAERGHLPRVFYTNTGYEYWGRAASLLHTSVDGSADVAPLPNERIYHLASTQHFPWRFPPGDSGGEPKLRAWRGNPIDFLVTERALLVALENWIESDVEPPSSSYPRIDTETLVTIDELDFPAIPQLAAPRVIHEAYRADYGPQWTAGIIEHQPPRLGPAFASLVSQVDALGNERAGVPTLELRAPLATYTPWHVRTGMAGGNGELTDFFGTYVPLPRDDAERERVGDPRPSVETLYNSREAYLEHAAAAAAELVDERWLLGEDVERVLGRAAAHWDWIHAP